VFESGDREEVTEEPLGGRDAFYLFIYHFSHISVSRTHTWYFHNADFISRRLREVKDGEKLPLLSQEKEEGAGLSYATEIIMSLQVKPRPQGEVTSLGSSPVQKNIEGTHR